MSKRTLILAAAAWLLQQGAAQKAHAHNFVGAQSCGSCHTFEYEVWASGPHARAHSSLTAEQLGDSRCASCHSNALAGLAQGTDAGGQGGPEGTKVEVGRRDEKLTPLARALQDKTLVGVQCEQCHGAGKLYQPEYVMRDKALSRLLGLVEPTAQGCQICHTDGAPSLEPFDYPRLWARIDHGAAAKARWLAAKEQGAAPPVLPETNAGLAPASSSQKKGVGKVRGGGRHRAHKNRRPQGRLRQAPGA